MSRLIGRNGVIIGRVPRPESTQNSRIADISSVLLWQDLHRERIFGRSQGSRQEILPARELMDAQQGDGQVRHIAWPNGGDNDIAIAINRERPAPVRSLAGKVPISKPLRRLQIAVVVRK